MRTEDEENKTNIEDTINITSSNNQETTGLRTSEDVQDPDRGHEVDSSVRYVGQYLAWLGDQLELNSTSSRTHYPTRLNTRATPNLRVGRTLAWIGDELERDHKLRQARSRKALELKFQPCVVVLSVMFCIVVAYSYGVKTRSA
jgi:hypothetical protein